jgi:hypothetical protein
VIADVDWSNLTFAGAFVVGAALGTLATIRVMRYVLGYVRRDHDRHDPTSM